MSELENLQAENAKLRDNLRVAKEELFNRVREDVPGGLVEARELIREAALNGTPSVAGYRFPSAVAAKMPVDDMVCVFLRIGLRALRREVEDSRCESDVICDLYHDAHMTEGEARAAMQTSDRQNALCHSLRILLASGVPADWLHAQVDSAVRDREFSVRHTKNLQRSELERELREEKPTRHLRAGEEWPDVEADRFGPSPIAKLMRVASLLLTYVGPDRLAEVCKIVAAETLDKMHLESLMQSGRIGDITKSAMLVYGVDDAQPKSGMV